jgi:hypothetical protein
VNRTLPPGIWGLLALVLVPMACGGGSGQKPIQIDYGQDSSILEVPEVLDETSEHGGRDTSREELPPNDHRFEIILLHDTSAPIAIASTESFAVRAKVVDYGQKVPATGMNVHFEIIEVQNFDGSNADTFDGSFEVQDVPSDYEGIAATLFRSGNGCDLKYLIEVSLPESDALPKTIELLVPCVACGCASVTFSYEGALPETVLRDIDVYVLPSDYSCDQLYPDRPAPEEGVLASRSVASLYGNTQFDCLQSEVTYTLFALGHRQGSPCVVTSGCTEGAYVKADECTDRKIKMYLATMNPAGLYDCIDHFDFTNLVKMCAGGDTTLLTCASDFTNLGKSVCCVLSEMIKFFETPGLTIVETLVDVAKQFIGSVIVDAVAGLFKDAVADVLTKWLKESSPAFMKDFLTIGSDMMGAITNLEMMSDLTLKKLTSDFTLQGNQFWHGLALYWKFGCDPAAPDYKQCGRIELNLESLNDPLFPKNLLGGQFTANLYDFDRLKIDQHAIELDYGKLVLYVLNQIIIKGITGGKADSLIEVAQLWINCNAVSTGIFGQILSWFGGSQPQIEAACNSTISFLMGFLDSFLGALSLDTTLSITGDARLVDQPNADQWCDLQVDKITQGKNVGFIQGNSTQASLTGDFECVKK